MILQMFKPAIDELHRRTGYQPESIVVTLPSPLFDLYVAEVVDRMAIGTITRPLDPRVLATFSIDGVTTFVRSKK